MLRTYNQADERDWERLLPSLEPAYNTTHHTNTELSPFEVMIGGNLVTAADLDILGTFSPTLSSPMTRLFRQLCDRARGHILKANWGQKFCADSKRRSVEYEVGDRAGLSAKHLLVLNHCPKFEPRYQDPFTITERIVNMAYSIALPPTYEGHNFFPVCQLALHRPRWDAQVQREAPVGWPPICDEAGKPTDQFLVNHILDQQGMGEFAGYLVKWGGAPEERAPWEPAHHVEGCPALVRAWKRRGHKQLRDQRYQTRSPASDPPSSPS